MGNFLGKMTGVFCFYSLSSFFFRKIKMTSTDFRVEAIDRLCFLCGSIIMKNGHHILPVLKEATSLTFERSINLLENVTSSNICHSCWAHRCSLFRGVRYSELSAIPEVSAIQRCPLFRGVRSIHELSAIQRCSLFRGFHIRFCTNSCCSKKMCPLFGGVRCSEVSAIHGCFKAEVLNFYINNSWENLLNDQKFAARHDNIHKCNIYFVARYEKNWPVVNQSTVPCRYIQWELGEFRR